MQKKRKTGLVLLAVIVMLAGSGCSRSVLNYQIAECIGTLGEYENNEPVETPKMKAAREQQESESELENVKRRWMRRQPWQKATGMRKRSRICRVSKSCRAMRGWKRRSQRMRKSREACISIPVISRIFPLRIW